MVAANTNQTELLEPIQTICMRLFGRRVSPSTVWRWAKSGGRGGKLKTVYLIGTWHTTESDFRDFLQRQTEAQYGIQSRSTADETATDAELQAAGLL